jgi:dihydrofolate reductase
MEVLMRNVIASEWVTLDGVFDADTMATWFNPYDSEERQAFIKEGIFAADALLFGRVTYEMLSRYWPKMKNNEMGIADRLNSLPKHVVSSTLEKAEWNNSTIIKSHVAETIIDLKKQAGRDILIFGSGDLVHSLLQRQLIDELRFLVHPIIAGTGKRFFRDGMAAKLEPVQTRNFDSGVIALYYSCRIASTGSRREAR